MLYLASASPRRSELLTQLGITYQVVVADVPEIRAADETALAYGYRVSLAKAEAASKACLNLLGFCRQILR